MLLELEDEGLVRRHTAWWRAGGRIADIGLSETFLDDVPVRLQIGKLDLMGFETDNGRLPWQAVPVLGFARWGLLALQKAAALGIDTYEIPGTGQALIFKAAGPTILTHSTTLEKTARGSYTGMVKSWASFANRVRDLVVQTFPGIEDFEGWKGWGAGKDDLPTHEASNRQWLLKSHEDCFDTIDALE